MERTMQSPARSRLWRSIGRTGYVFQPQVQITSGTAIYPSTELSQLDVMFEAGGVVT